MRALVTFGPTFENLDKVRRLTNFSTGTLGTELANFLVDRGHDVLGLRGHYATCRQVCRAQTLTEYTTTSDLQQKLVEASREHFDAIFHAAAVSDFGFGKVWSRDATGALREITSGKFGTRDGNLLVELVPTPKLISGLRPLFPPAKIFGWKYEVDGARDSTIALGLRQVRENSTNFCVVNGAAYGPGFGIVSGKGFEEHCADSPALFNSLLRLAGN